MNNLPYVTQCSLCHSNTSIWEHPKTMELFYYCNRCEFIQKDKKHWISSEKEKSRYLLHNNGMNNLEYVSYLRRFMDEAIVPFVQKEMQGLDYGSGPYPALVELVSKEYPYRIEPYDVYFHPTLTAKREVFDFITCVEVIEHLSSPLSVLEEMVALLKQKGILAIQTSFHYADKKRFFQWHYIRDETHIGFYNTNTFKYIEQTLSLKTLYHNNKNVIVFQKT